MSTTVDITPTVPAGRWTIDLAHTSVEFVVRHLGIATVKGRAAAVSGTITGGDEPRIEGVVDARSITTHDATRDEHLGSPEFFDAARYPELRFTSTAIEGSADELLVSGALTIKGITRPVVLRGVLSGPRTDPWGGSRIGIDLDGEIDRTAFGLRWNAPLPGGGFLLGDTVGLSGSFSAVEEDAR
jgi:polyisoprenoid-binding protein YceI